MRKKERKAEERAERANKDNEEEKKEESYTEAPRPKGPTQKEKRQKYKDDVQAGQTVIIDCSFQDLLIQKELNSLCSQLAYCQASNKAHDIPTRLTITNFRGKVKDKLDRLGVDNWGVVLHEKHYTEHYDPKDMVYLTGDAEEEIEELDPKYHYKGFKHLL